MFDHRDERTLEVPPEGPPDSHTSPTVMFPSREQSVWRSAPAALRGEAVTALNTNVLPSLSALLQDRSMFLGPTFDVDAIYSVLLLLVPALYG